LYWLAVPGRAANRSKATEQFPDDAGDAVTLTTMPVSTPEGPKFSMELDGDDEAVTVFEDASRTSDANVIAGATSTGIGLVLPTSTGNTGFVT